MENFLSTRNLQISEIFCIPVKTQTKYEATWKNQKKEKSKTLISGYLAKCLSCVKKKLFFWNMFFFAVGKFAEFLLLEKLKILATRKVFWRTPVVYSTHPQSFKSISIFLVELSPPAFLMQKTAKFWPLLWGKSHRTFTISDFFEIRPHVRGMEPVIVPDFCTAGRDGFTMFWSLHVVVGLDFQID